MGCKFWFRTNIFDDGEPVMEELYLDEIMFGKESVFEGLFEVASNIWEDFLADVYKESHIK